MNKEILLDVIQRTDIDIKIRQGMAELDPEMQTDIDIAHRLLRQLKNGVVRGDKTISLGDSWSLAAVGWILPAINSLEKNGISVSYMSAESQAAEIAQTEVDIDV